MKSMLHPSPLKTSNTDIFAIWYLSRGNQRPPRGRPSPCHQFHMIHSYHTGRVNPLLFYSLLYQTASKLGTMETRRVQAVGLV